MTLRTRCVRMLSGGATTRRCRTLKLYLTFALLFMATTSLWNSARNLYCRQFQGGHGKMLLYVTNIDETTDTQNDISFLGITRSLATTNYYKNEDIAIENTTTELIVVPTSTLKVTDRIEKTVPLPMPGSRYVYEQQRILELARHNASLRAASVAIGCAITSRGLATSGGGRRWKKRIQNLPFFTELLPSFCRTASSTFSYRFYLAYDQDDPWLSVEKAKNAFDAMFKIKVDALCVQNDTKVKVDHLMIRCNHSGAPAWAQNDAMMAAYNDDVRMEYFYRVNDDTVLKTPGWTESFVHILIQFQPPNLGVVGPGLVKNGSSNETILMYDFVHRTHIDIFKFYYPRELRTLYADDWITHVHQPRSARVKDVEVIHSGRLKMRYTRDNVTYEVLDGLIKTGRDVIRRLVEPPVVKPKRKHKARKPKKKKN